MTEAENSHKLLLLNLPTILANFLPTTQWCPRCPFSSMVIHILMMSISDHRGFFASKLSFKPYNLISCWVHIFCNDGYNSKKMGNCTLMRDHQSLQQPLLSKCKRPLFCLLFPILHLDFDHLICFASRCCCNLPLILFIANLLLL